jgi:hypothetical protein
MTETTMTEHSKEPCSATDYFGRTIVTVEEAQWLADRINALAGLRPEKLGPLVEACKRMCAEPTTNGVIAALLHVDAALAELET